jgi:23S rRNA (adenine2503-C2)-methyltransferase
MNDQKFNMKTSLCGIINEELHEYIHLKGFDRIHTLKVLQSVYRKQKREIVQFPSIPGILRTQLMTDFVVGTYSPITAQKSVDGTIKYLFRNDSGQEFETVYLPDGKRTTVCVSVQSGCRIGCPFCNTGKFGFQGNLSAGDIINQVISLPDSNKVTNIVFMGMGEPMDNIEEVIKACTILTAEWGLSIGCRNITVSTVGILPGIKEFIKRSDCNLAISLHSPFPEERSKVVPVENKYPVRKTIEFLKSFPVKKKRRLSIAYVMIKGFNDTEKHLAELIHLFSGTSLRINLLPYHNTGNEEAQTSDEERMQFFKHKLVTSGLSASIRKSRGKDISAACGLLASGWKKM